MQQSNSFVVCRDTQVGSENVVPKVPVRVGSANDSCSSSLSPVDTSHALPHQSRTAQLDLVVFVKRLLEAALVVVISMSLSVVLCSNIDDNRGLLNDALLPCTLQPSRCKLGQLAEKVHGEGLVGVVCAVVRDNGGIGIQLGALGLGGSHPGE